MHSKNITRYVESSCTEIHLHAWNMVCASFRLVDNRALSVCWRHICLTEVAAYSDCRAGASLSKPPPYILRCGPLFVLMNIRLSPFRTSFPSTPLQLRKHRIANWICRSTSGTIILKVRGGSKFASGASEKFLTSPCLKFTSVGPFEPEVKAGKVKGLYFCGPLQFIGPFICFASVWPYTPTVWVQKLVP